MQTRTTNYRAAETMDKQFQMFIQTVTKHQKTHHRLLPRRRMNFFHMRINSIHKWFTMIIRHKSLFPRIQTKQTLDKMEKYLRVVLDKLHKYQNQVCFLSLAREHKTRAFRSADKGFIRVCHRLRKCIHQYFYDKHTKGNYTKILKPPALWHNLDSLSTPYVNLGEPSRTNLGPNLV